MKKAAVLWTGGKDSALALYEAKQSGYEINSLVTFTPESPNFLAHPLAVMKLQAEAVGLPHIEIKIAEPYKESYEAAIQSLKKQGIGTLVTGDITEIDHCPNWIGECSKKSGMEVFAPLWYQDREYLLNHLLSKKFKIIFSCLKKPWFKDDSLLGIQLNKETIDEVKLIARSTGMDICGEQGEYHTWALDGPVFNKPLTVDYVKSNQDDLSYLRLL